MEEIMLAVAQIQGMVTHLKWSIDSMISYLPHQLQYLYQSIVIISIGVILLTRHFKIVNLYNLHFRIFLHIEHISDIIKNWGTYISHICAPCNVDLSELEVFL